MNIRNVEIICDYCGSKHQIEIDTSNLSKDQLSGKEPILLDYNCPEVALMYRVVSYAIDTRVNVLNDMNINKAHEGIISNLKAIWGEYDFESKLKRFKTLNLAIVGIPEEYYSLLITIINTYCCGYFYPAMTSVGALGERILNRLILKTRDRFKSTEQYKKVYKKNSFDNWDIPISVLKEWQIISDDTAKEFAHLQKYRNDSIHYTDKYDFESKSHDAIKILKNIIDNQYNYISRKDLFWVFDIPGEIWLRSSVIDDPFVIEFILAHCVQLTPFCEPFANPPIRGKNAPRKPLSDEEFIKIRKSHKTH